MTFDVDVSTIDARVMFGTIGLDGEGGGSSGMGGVEDGGIGIGVGWHYYWWW